MATDDFRQPRMPYTLDMGGFYHRSQELDMLRAKFALTALVLLITGVATWLTMAVCHNLDLWGGHWTRYLGAKAGLSEFVAVLVGVSALTRAARRGAWSLCALFTAVGLLLAVGGALAGTTVPATVGLMILDMGHLVGSPRHALDVAHDIEHIGRRSARHRALRRVRCWWCKTGPGSR